MSRILIVTPVPTLPADAGNRARIKTMLDALERAGHTVVILHAHREPGDPEAMRARWGDAYIPVSYTEPRRPWVQRIKRWQRRLKQSAGYTTALDGWYDTALDAHIKIALRNWDIDVVLAEYVFFSKALDAVPDNVLKIIDTHDRFANRHAAFLEAGLEPAWYSCTPADEARGIGRADVVLAIQDNEAEYFRAITDATVATVGHLVEIAAPSPYPTDQILLTVGSANSINIDSARWYLSEVWPAVAEQLPEARFRIAGGLCADLNSDHPRVELLGRVDDLSDEYAQAQVVLNPMLTGTGLKIKSVEAMGAGRALLSTEAGADGLADAVDDSLIQADGTQAMIEQSVQLLSNPTRCADIAGKARTFAERYNTRCLAAFTAALENH